MKLLVVLLNYRTAEMTLDALRASLRAIENIPDTRIDIVDNDSGDGSYERLCEGVRSAGYPPERVQVLASPHNGGFGAGNNFAIRRALASDDPPELILIQNSDAFPDPDAIEALVSFLDSHPRAGIAGSALRGTDGIPHVSAFRFPSLLSELELGLSLGVVSKALARHRVTLTPPPTATCEVDWLAGASMMARASMLREIGLFDETFFLYFEETDLCRRAWAAGWSAWYVVESKVVHVGSASTGMSRWRTVPRYWFDSRRHYFVKNHGPGYYHLANALFAVSHGIYTARAAIQRKQSHLPGNFYLDFLSYLVSRAPAPSGAASRA